MLRVILAIVTGIALSLAGEAKAQVQIDISSDEAKQATGAIYISDLGIHDVAFFYGGFCIKDGGLYVPGWREPASFEKQTWTASGVVLRVEILPGKRLKATYVDARQQQLRAAGAVGAKSDMTTQDYNREVRQQIENIFEGGAFGTVMCDDNERSNPLRSTDLYAVESLNGYKKLSELLASTKSAQ